MLKNHLHHVETQASVQYIPVKISRSAQIKFPRKKSNPILKIDDPSPLDFSTTTLLSPYGPLLIDASDKGVRRITFKFKSMSFPDSDTKRRKTARDKILEKAKMQLLEYFDGNCKPFNLPFDREAIGGSEFQRKIWKGLLTIPFGETCSYQELADRLKLGQAARAVGTACSKNPICLVVPCHRVVSSSQGFGGYAFGTELKAQLLERESLVMKRSQVRR
jgi:methylated-DNA-[protein]-cysteine S-methyltransferase